MGLNFNSQQLEAINFLNGSCAIIAGAGSGKSTVLINRIKNLVNTHNVNQRDILAISFTNNTAKDLKKKLNNMSLDSVNIGTYHSICQKILMNNGINIDHNNLVKEWQIEKCFKVIDAKANIKDIVSFINYQKSYLKFCNDEFVYKESQYSETELRKFYKEYELMKNKLKVYDFDDWLIECYKFLKKSNISYKYILVDEHQDSNLVQNLILKEICKSGNLMVVGDYKQCIFEFRGATPEQFMYFDKEWKNSSIINLDINYRSTSNIVNNANSFIRKYYGDYEYYSDSIANNKLDGTIDVKTYGSSAEEGLKVANIIENLIKDGENPEEIAVLYRLNINSSSLENELKLKNIKYDISNDSSFFKRKEIAAIISYLRLVNDPNNDGAFESVFKLRNYPLTFFSNDVLENIRRHSGKNNLSMFESFLSLKYDKPWQKSNVNIFKDNLFRLKLQRDKKIDISKLIDNIIKTFNFKEYLQEKYTDKEDLKERLNSVDILKTFIKSNDLEKFLQYVENIDQNKKNTKGVKLMTIHASKGLEFKNVFLISIEDGKFPHEKSGVVDEARLFYVGVTRAKENLYLSQINSNNRFVKEYFE